MVKFSSPSQPSRRQSSQCRCWLPKKRPRFHVSAGSVFGRKLQQWVKTRELKTHSRFVISHHQHCPPSLWPPVCSLLTKASQHIHTHTRSPLVSVCRLTHPLITTHNPLSPLFSSVSPSSRYFSPSISFLPLFLRGLLPPLLPTPSLLVFFPTLISSLPPSCISAAYRSTARCTVVRGGVLT